MKALYKLVEDFLKSNQDKKFTSKDIAIEIYNRNNKAYEQKRQNFETDEALLKQLAAEVSRDKNKLLDIEGIFIEEANTPYLFYYSKEKHKNSDESKKTTKQNNQDKIKEEELYPKLADFLKSHFNILSKRIDEKKSKNNKGKNWNKWLHPDLTGIKVLDNNWSEDIKKCYKKAGNNSLEIFSYEVKIELTVSNLRESFFQAVSNSSWANFGYLVTSEIKGNILSEIEMLSKLHGIGIIKLNIENPPESQVLFPAQHRENIDWNTTNRVTVENKDFAEFIKSVEAYYSLGRTDSRDWYSEND